MPAGRSDAAATHILEPQSEREIVITRLFDAPPELVFDAFIDREHLSRWWGPNGFSVTTHDMDVRPGGVWRYTMHGPDGTDWPNLVTYHEIDRPRLLTYEHGTDDEPAQFQSSISFELRDGKTEVTMRAILPTTAARDFEIEHHGAVEGGKQTLARLAEHLAGRIVAKRLQVTLPSDLEVVLTRVFSAPCRLVFEALTKPEHLRNWYGPHGYTLPVCEIDLRPGGSWHYLLRSAAGDEMAMRGTYHEIVPHERLVSTESYDIPGLGWTPDSVVTTTLDERDGVTLLTSRILYTSIHDRDGHVNSGMEGGAGETFDRLDDYLGGME